MVDEGLIHGHLTFGLRPFDLPIGPNVQHFDPSAEGISGMTKMTLTSLPFYRLKKRIQKK